MRTINLVLIGSLCVASRMASWARLLSTPSISKSILPGLTMAAQYSGAPFPLPILTSAGFLVMGLSGKILIQTCPCLLMALVMAIRVASICLAVIQAGSSALRPKVPNAIELPLQASPLMRPFCTFLYFVLLGCSMVLGFIYVLLAGGGLLSGFLLGSCGVFHCRGFCYCMGG